MRVPPRSRFPATLPLALAAALAAGLYSCADTGPHGGTAGSVALDPAESAWLAANRDGLSFAPDPFYAPFEFLDEEDGTTKGLSNDYLELVERKLGLRFKRIRAGSFEDILELARQRRVSVVNAVTETPERSAYLDFTEPVLEIRNVILVRRDADNDLTLDDLEGRTVALVRDYAVTEHLAATRPGIRFDIVTTDLEALLAVSYDMADAAVIDLATASWLTQREGLTNLKVAGDAGYPVRLAIGSRNDWPELGRILAKAVAAITADERRDILDRWIVLGDERYEHLRMFYLLLAMVAAGLLGGWGMVLLWNGQLKRRIAARTASLDRALAEKEALVRELHHRTNNALNITLSMLQLEAGATGDAAALGSLLGIQHRVMAMALVYQRLKESDEFTTIDLKAYLSDLAGQLVANDGGAPGRIRLDLDLEPASLLFDIAIPVGLVVNELVCDSLATSFPGGRRGAIRISLRRDGDHALELGYRDDGVGRAAGFEPRDSGPAGLRLAVMTVEYQLQGSIGFDAGPALGCTVRFRDDVYARRV